MGTIYILADTGPKNAKEDKQAYNGYKTQWSLAGHRKAGTAKV